MKTVSVLIAVVLLAGCSGMRMGGGGGVMSGGGMSSGGMSSGSHWSGAGGYGGMMDPSDRTRVQPYGSGT